MSLSASLWDSLSPPGVWVTIGKLECGEADHVNLTVRVQEEGRRSVSVTVPVTRYAPTDSIVLAASKCLQALAVAQQPVNRIGLEEQLRAAVANWAEPF